METRVAIACALLLALIAGACVSGRALDPRVEEPEPPPPVVAQDQEDFDARIHPEHAPAEDLEKILGQLLEPSKRCAFWLPEHWKDRSGQIDMPGAVTVVRALGPHTLGVRASPDDLESILELVRRIDMRVED